MSLSLRSLDMTLFRSPYVMASTPLSFGVAIVRAVILRRALFWVAQRLVAGAFNALLAAAPAQGEPVDRFPGAAPGYLVAINGTVQWARNADTPRSPASLTKLLTALVLLERGWDDATIVRVSKRAVTAEGARVRLRTHERVRAGELLAAMLVASSNDACVALIEHAAASRALFVARMNRRAAALGMQRSFFSDPCGFDRERQQSTPNDLLRLARAALAEPTIAQLVGQPGGELRTLGGRSLPYRTTNLMLGRLAGAQGMKTGHTAKAGRCLIALAQRGATTVIVVLLDAHDRWWTGEILIEEAFRVGAARG